MVRIEHCLRCLVQVPWWSLVLPMDVLRVSGIKVAKGLQATLKFCAQVGIRAHFGWLTDDAQNEGKEKREAVSLMHIHVLCRRYAQAWRGTG